MAPGGSLVFIGSGIRSVSQFTLEGINYLKDADIVYYAVNDPVTEGFIKKNNQVSVDLYQYYARGKPRSDIYIIISEIILNSVREGKKVVGALYGHPGFCVSPSRRAISIARAEGYDAKMIPGVSSEDCLIADLLIDPGVPGLHSIEATCLLSQTHVLNKTCHVILYQVGVTGAINYDYDHNHQLLNPHFKTLVDRLVHEYGKAHPVVNYIASLTPLEPSTIQQYTMADLYKEEVQAKITGASTFYIPPLPILTETAQLVEAGVSTWTLPGIGKYSDNTASRSKYYGERENECVASMTTHTVPAEYKKYRASPVMQELVERITLDPTTLQEFQENPQKFASLHPGLTPYEIQALASGKVGNIYGEMWGGKNPDPDSGPLGRPFIIILF